MKLKLNLVGDSFSHLSGGNKGYSVHGKESQYIEWIRDGSAGETVYVDEGMETAFADARPGLKYGWLLESRFVVPDIVARIKADPRRYLETFALIFTHDSELLALDPKFRWCPASGYWIEEPKLYPKSKLVSMIASNKAMTDGHRIRLAWVQKLKGKADVYGRGFNEIARKEQGLCDYMFSVAIENGCYTSYFTEKILDCFATGTIPVYLGTPDIGDYFNRDGIIDLTEDLRVTPELYRERLDAVRDNFERVQQYAALEDFIFLRHLNPPAEAAAFALAGQGALDAVGVVKAAETLVAEGLGQRAIELYRRWLTDTASPLAFAIYFNLGVALENAGDFPAAAQAYRRALSLNPGFGPAEANLAALLNRVGRAAAMEPGR